MRLLNKSFIISMTVLFLFIGWQSQQTAESNELHEYACETCEKGQTGGAVWCDNCKVGYIDGIKVKCKSCFEGRTGKSIWCESCNAGYVDGKKIVCKGCFESKTKGTVCEVCKG